MKAYKLLRVRKDGTLGSLFINRTLVITPNKWLQAESHWTKNYVYRPGWHATAAPVAPHLHMNGRKWYYVEITGVDKLRRPNSQGTMWYIAERMRVLKEVN